MKQISLPLPPSPKASDGIILQVFSFMNTAENVYVFFPS